MIRDVYHDAVHIYITVRICILGAVLSYPLPTKSAYATDEGCPKPRNRACQVALMSNKFAFLTADYPRMTRCIRRLQSMASIMLMCFGSGKVCRVSFIDESSNQIFSRHMTSSKFPKNVIIIH